MEAWDTAGGDGRKGVERARKGRIWSIWQSTFLLRHRGQLTSLPVSHARHNRLIVDAAEQEPQGHPPSHFLQVVARDVGDTLFFGEVLFGSATCSRMYDSWKRLSFLCLSQPFFFESSPSKGWDAAVVTARPTNLARQPTCMDTTSRDLRALCGSSACNLGNSGTWNSPEATS